MMRDTGSLKGRLEIMSATGRSDVRHADDFYRTPAWCVRALLKYVKATSEEDYAALHNSSILDPACGDGAILQVLDSYGFKAVGIEIDPMRAERAREHGFGVYCGDALVTYISAQAVITNPPYSLAMEFVQENAITSRSPCLLCGVPSAAQLASEPKAREVPSRYACGYPRLAEAA
jgi:hypothetical protein